MVVRRPLAARVDIACDNRHRWILEFEILTNIDVQIWEYQTCWWHLLLCDIKNKHDDSNRRPKATLKQASRNNKPLYKNW